METTYKTHTRDLELKSYKDYFNIWFFGDVHRDSEACDADRWKWFLKKAANDDPEKTYYFGLGDYHDFASYSEQKALKNSGLHEQTMQRLHKMVRSDIDFFHDEAKQMDGRMLGMVEGNHTWTFDDGATATEVLAEKFHSQYLGWLCHYTLTVNFKNNRSQNIYIVACHGKAGGKRIGTSINQLEDMKTIFPIADVYVMGHNHDRGAWPIDILIPSRRGDMKQKRQFLVRSGSFLKGYEPNTNSYVASRLLRPADIGAIKLNFSFHRDREEGDRIITDITATI